jgi:hypothetical protein
MRFRNQDAAWTSWEAYSGSKSWPIAAVENTVRYVWAEFRDPAGNVIQVWDSIYYDAVRRLRFMAEQIYIEDDADGGLAGPGEIFWHFGGYNTSDVASNIYNTDESVGVPIESGNHYDFADASMIISMANIRGESYRLVLRIAEDDWVGVGGYVWSNEGSVTYYQSSDQSSGWGIGSRSLHASGTPGGTMYFRIEKVD